MANTNTTNLTQELMDVISAEMLIQPDDVYLFRQFGPVQEPMPGEVATPGLGGAKQLLFNRPVLATGTYTETSRRMTDGTPVDLTGIAIAMTQVGLTVREYAGPHDGTRITPFVVTEYLKNRARHNVIAIVGEFLRRDRNKFVDTTVRDLLLAATTVALPAATEGTITAGQVMTAAFLRTLNKTMKDSKIPTFANGRWRYVISTRDEMNLKADAEYREANRYFMAQNPAFSGHVGSFEGFDLAVATTLPTKGVGAGSAVTGYQGVVFGPYGIGHGIAMAPNVRAADDTDFGRRESVIWKSEECVGTLYADLLVRTITT